MAESNGMSLAQLERRISLNKQSGWGLEKGSPAQLNLLALYCQKHHLLPGDDVTLYEGRPWITIDGRVKLMRRNADYRGHTVRPLKPDEKKDFGYDVDDIVIEALVYVAGYEKPIQGYGRVSKAERYGQRVEGVRHNPIARNNPVEMATKRAISRAERFAFGTEAYVDDEQVEEAVQTVISEASEHQAERAQKYVQIYGDDTRRVDKTTGGQSKVTMTSVIGQRFAELFQEAVGLELDVDDLKVSFPADYETVVRAGERLKDRIDDAHRTAALEERSDDGLEATS